MATRIPVIFVPEGHKKTERAMGGVSNSAKKLAKVLGPLILGAAVLKLGKSAITTAGQFEALRTRLTAMTGSVQRGTQLFDKFNKVAATTPFAVANVVEAGASLQAFGVNSEKMIKPVADLAAFMGLDIVEASQAMGRAFAGGAGAADILRERGILQLIKDSQGIEDLTKLTLPQFRKALETAMMDPQGKIAGATDLLAKTWQGKLSNMQDAWSRLLAALGDKMLPFAKNVVTRITTLLEDAISEVDMVDWEKTLEVENFKVLVGNMGKAIVDIFALTLDFITPSFKGFVSGIITDINSIGPSIFESLVGTFMGMIAGVKIVFMETLFAFKFSAIETANSIVDSFNEIFGTTFEGLKPLTTEDKDAFLESYYDTYRILQEQFESFGIGELFSVPDDAVDGIGEYGEAVLGFLNNITDGVLEFKEATGVDEEGNAVPPGGVTTEQVEHQAELFTMMFEARKKYQENQAKLDAEAAKRGKASFIKNLAIASDQFDAFHKLQKAQAIREVLMKTDETVVTAYREGVAAGKGWLSIPTGVLFAATALAAQMAQVQKIKSAAVGFSGQVTEPTTFVVGEAGPENVEVTPLNAPNVRGGEAGGGGQNVNIFFEGNVMDEDYIVDTAIPMIRDAVRRGETLVD